LTLFLVTFTGLLQTGFLSQQPTGTGYEPVNKQKDLDNQLILPLGSNTSDLINIFKVDLL
jgi:hypothetical protein